jgi:nicotinamidase-related amidase
MDDTSIRERPPELEKVRQPQWRGGRNEMQYRRPATVIDKSRFSGFAQSQLFAHLQPRDADGLVITGSETDVCVLGTVLAAVDIGYRVIIVRDAICSSSDKGHEALMEVYHSRFSEQIETANADEILTAWE